MGFNLSGLAIGKNYKDDVDALFEALGWEAKLQGEVSFEEASANWKDEGICDIYFTEGGTLVFLEMSQCTEEWVIDDVDVLTFLISEVSMTFSLNYVKQNELVRTFESEGNVIADEGEKLEVELGGGSADEIIWQQVAAIIGQPFWDIDLEALALRYEVEL